MTDNQVIEYVKQQKQLGKTERQIGKELIAQGVTKEQLERLRSKYSEASENTQKVVAEVSRDVKRTSNETAPQESRNIAVAQGETYMPEVASPAPVTGAGGRNIFGRDVFSSSALSFEPNENQATPKDYRLGPGDEVIIEIWGASEERLRQTISPEGNIVVEQLGPIFLNGMTIDEANDHLRGLFAYKYAGIDEGETDITLTLGGIRTIQVNIIGEVSTPGTYRLSPFSTVFHAIYRSGGVSGIGSLRNIQVLRNGRKIATVDLYDFLFGGDSNDNLRLQEGDVIIVPAYENLVKIDGNVKRPMNYEIKNDETITDLVKYAGGFKSDAYTDAVRVKRENDRENELHNVEAAEFVTYRLKDGDVVTVGELLDRYTNRVQIRGQVMRPGMFALGNDINTLLQLINKADGLKEDAYLERALIFREGPDLTMQVIPVNLGALMAGTTEDIQLQRNDIVEIAGIHEILDRGGFTIRGLVADPGTYPFAENTTIEDLVLQAGGLLYGASTARIEVARRVNDPQAMTTDNATAQIYTFSYDNGNIGTGFTLEPYDIVTVRKSPSYVVQQRVAIGGEVIFEGPYTIAKRNERISDLVARAGGLTSAAYARGAHLSRELSESEIQARDESVRLARMMQNGEQSDSISMDKIISSNRYNVGIELEKALANPGCEEDLVLQEGDVLFIPQMVNTVRVHGDVMYPNTVVYKKGAKLKYYINQAGGYGTSAKKGKAYVVYMNGTVAKAKGSVRIEPGCQIIVPSKAPSNGPNWQAIMSMTSIGGTLGTMAAAIATLLK
ncbi:MAG: SLBB domain-containing protein [Candidatus Amulumruptor sp.]|nr:SLBB domain-containing protein [Candidatus Amulumruptor sp.]